ncbi:peptide-methionine (S)-S-oxide reductase MsrA [Methylobacterium nigriterrae]|uniref:peptide-methionine (S)-S-oxide reductase MsrA n=1 Tax=Methylobacterium nigriterrae TaxID=3127512 RepID=UPI003013814F
MSRLTLNRLARRLWPGLWPSAVAVMAGVGLLAGLHSYGLAEEASRRLPEAALQATEPTGGLRTATLAGGCFWGVQGVFEHVRGVKQAVSGYAGGSRDSATYETVSSGETDHAEAVRITYDPSVIRYDEVLQIFFSIALDPTQVNRQGPDTGPQYRSAIFPSDAEQERVATSYIAQLEAAKLYSRPIATKIERDAAFYPAEDYHQDFMALHPRHLYIVANDAPKLRDLQRLFPERATSKPVRRHHS